MSPSRPLIGGPSFRRRVLCFSIAIALESCRLTTAGSQHGSQHRITISVKPGHVAPEDARAILETAIRGRASGRMDEVPQGPGSVVFKTSEIVVQTVRYLPSIPVKSESAVVRIPLEKPIESYECSPGNGCYTWVRAAWNVQRDPGTWRFWSSKANEAKLAAIIDAFNELVSRNIHADLLDADFPAKAAAWRANPAKALSPEGERRRVLAENAFREKDVPVAIEHFTAALETDPTWADGNFNLALLLGESGEYRQAARYMKRYLLLVPDSKDAKAAREKIIIWEDKASRAAP